MWFEAVKTYTIAGQRIVLRVASLNGRMIKRDDDEHRFLTSIVSVNPNSELDSKVKGGWQARMLADIKSYIDDKIHESFRENRNFRYTRSAYAGDENHLYYQFGPSLIPTTSEEIPPKEGHEKIEETLQSLAQEIPDLSLFEDILKISQQRLQKRDQSREPTGR